MECRVNRSSLNKTAIWAGAFNFNHPSMMTSPVYHVKERKFKTNKNFTLERAALNNLERES